VLTETKLINRNPEILGGIPVFMGTRVPVQNLLDYLAGSYSLDKFLDDFPAVTREQAVQLLELLELLKEKLLAQPL
jgi:uncharacterized protein (DUF433 family)